MCNLSLRTVLSSWVKKNLFIRLPPFNRLKGFKFLRLAVSVNVRSNTLIIQPLGYSFNLDIHAQFFRIYSKSLSDSFRKKLSALIHRRFNGSVLHASSNINKPSRQIHDLRLPSCCYPATLAEIRRLRCLATYLACHHLPLSLL